MVNSRVVGSQQKKTEDENLEGARSFVKNVFAKISAQKTKIVSANHQWNDEWKEAARELFGSKEKRTVDEALTAVRTPSMKPTTAPAEGEEPTEYTGTSALVAVKEEESAWQKVSARFREAPIIQGILDAAKQAARTEAGKKVGAKAKQARDKIGDAKEEVLEIWETSQNPYEELGTILVLRWMGYLILICDR
jgi:archaellum component FlaD/FlaE